MKYWVQTYANSPLMIHFKVMLIIIKINTLSLYGSDGELKLQHEPLCLHKKCMP